ncbi:MAG: electron transport complex subunit E [Oscillospiraceae bacterium]|nr:electron transport complex subunit E [Oscillospiraceae bacterium]
MAETSHLKELTKGLLRENPTLVGLLGMCPTLAVTSQASNALGMGLATTFVLIGSNLVISLLRRVIPATVKLPCYIVIIAGFVTIIDFLIHGFLPELHEALGTFLSLITVNCIILGRAEMFACKHGPLPSVLDGLGMGLGFTGSLFVIGSVREIFGQASWMGLALPEGFPTMSLFSQTAGGFLVLGFLIAIVGRMTKKPQTQGCAGHCAGCAAGCAAPEEGGGKA